MIIEVVSNQCKNLSIQVKTENFNKISISDWVITEDLLSQKPKLRI